ncbi:MAG: M20 metallopeptidase family protein [Planctomycetota bacterium]|jgi:metal-dependent amidase/aminoacylase/carboxypeptidase family protein
MTWNSLQDRVATMLPELRRIRHDLHQHPELGFEEHRTQDVVRRWLRTHGYEPRDCAGTGLVADLKPDAAPKLALRADLDALPIHEQTDLPYRSVHDGVAHKCGHDGHTAILMGVAALLAAARDDVRGNVRLLFQPAEEGVRGGGAKVMIAAGALQDVPEVYGLHSWPGFPKGELRVRAGPVLAQVDNFHLRLVGEGGHGAQPHRCKDPIVAAAQIVSALQTVVARSVGPNDDAAVRERVHGRVQDIVGSVGHAMGVAPALDIQPEYPVLNNEAGCAEIVRQVAARILGPDKVSGSDLPLAVSEDFAYLAEAVPAAYFFLGAGGAGAETPGCHHPDFDFDDDLLAIGVRMFLGLCEARTG